MSDEIQEKLEEIYKFPIEVFFRTVKCYDIFCKLEKGSFIVALLYDETKTLDSNISKICTKIDKGILAVYKRKVEV